MKGKESSTVEDKHELFLRLLEQIKWQDLPEEEGLFADATINKVEVHTESGRWNFYIGLKQVLPFTTFLRFEHALKTAFSAIAQTEITLTVQEPQLSDKNLGDYWTYVVSHCGLNSSLVKELCQGKVPYLDGKRVMLLAENEIIKQFLTTQALGPIESTYQRYGFPKFTINTLIDETKSQEKN